MSTPSQNWGEGFFISRSKIEKNLNQIKNDIAHCNVKIIAVTKYFGLEGIVEGYRAGLRDFGESRAKDAIEKIKSLPKDMRENSTFHFIGHLQSNKAEKVVEYFDVIHSIDSFKIAEVVSKAACSLNKREKVLLQVNNAGEEQKFGYSMQQLEEEMKLLLDLKGIEIVGLMNIAPLNASEEVLNELFGEIRDFRNFLEINNF